MLAVVFILTAELQLVPLQQRATVGLKQHSVVSGVRRAARLVDAHMLPFATVGL